MAKNSQSTTDDVFNRILEMGVNKITSSITDKKNTNSMYKSKDSKGNNITNIVIHSISTTIISKEQPGNSSGISRNLTITTEPTLGLPLYNDNFEGVLDAALYQCKSSLFIRPSNLPFYDDTIHKSRTNVESNKNNHDYKIPFVPSPSHSSKDKNHLIYRTDIDYSTVTISSDRQYSRSNETKKIRQVHVSYLHDTLAVRRIEESNITPSVIQSHTPVLDTPSTLSPDIPLNRKSTTVISQSKQNPTAVSGEENEVVSSINSISNLSGVNNESNKIQLTDYSVVKQINNYVSDSTSSNAQINNKDDQQLSYDKDNEYDQHTPYEIFDAHIPTMFVELKSSTEDVVHRQTQDYISTPKHSSTPLHHNIQQFSDFIIILPVAKKLLNTAPLYLHQIKTRID